MSKLSRSTRRHAAISTAAVSAALLLALTGCAGSGQSKAAGCKTLEAAVSSASTDLQSSLSSVSSDPTKASAKLSALSKAFDRGLAKVSNADVKKAGDKANTSLKKFVTEYKAYAKDPSSADAATITKTVSTLQKNFTAIGTVCK